MTKKFNVTIQCMAVYTATIEVDDDASYEEALEEVNSIRHRFELQKQDKKPYIKKK